MNPSQIAQTNEEQLKNTTDMYTKRIEKKIVSPKYRYVQSPKVLDLVKRGAKSEVLGEEAPINVASFMRLAVRCESFDMRKLDANDHPNPLS